MSKMREAFECHALTFTPPLVLARSEDDYSDGETAIAWNDFKAGYQAAIAAVKEGGPSAWIASDCESFSFTEPPSKNWLKMAWWKPAYHLPEDLT